ncbi:LAMI_0C10616g1_1 [Lachancea mirantina]|uniref:LAMI_0C10616g1_1 n=1 Tax=Lachancea mirantina TaxID=1230905 RepID=A0A1G4J6Q2_9SACH|nr:LAMI_0C10616g1_1 [Lachancea mirantina]
MSASVHPDAQRQRARVRKACVTCKRRKVKCDGDQPCSNCVRHDVVCVYAAHAAAQARAQAREEPMHGSAQTSPYAGAGAPASAAVPSPWQTFSPDKYRFHRRPQNFLPFYLGQALLQAIPQNVARDHALEPPRVQNYGWNMSGRHYLGPQRLDSPPWQWNFARPLERAVALKLVDVYFARVNPVLALVHERVFRQQLRSGVLDEPQGSSDLFAALLHLMMATALRFCEGRAENEQVIWDEAERTAVPAGTEERLFAFAFRVISQLSFEWESFELIQGWLLVASYLRTCHRQTSCWQALGRAIHMCNGMALYLNRFPQNHSAYDEQRARYCFWACFVADKIFSFQMGRFPQLPAPSPQMDGPRCSGAEDWFTPQAVAMWELSLIVADCQKRDGQELTIDEAHAVLLRLDQWEARHGCGDAAGDGARDGGSDGGSDAGGLLGDLCGAQVSLTYVDVRLTLELRGVFQLIEPPGDASVARYARYATLEGLASAWPLNASALLRFGNRAVRLLQAVRADSQFFQPWWLNLSLLFSANLAGIALTQAGVRSTESRELIAVCSDMWDFIAASHPQNPPNMVGECLWCLKMLAHMSYLRMKTCSQALKSQVGFDHNDNSLNRNKFRQFGKVDDDQSPDSRLATLDQDRQDVHNPFYDAENNLLAHLQWFDQWYDINALDG